MKEKISQLAPFAVPVHVIPNIVDSNASTDGRDSRRPLEFSWPFKIVMVANLVPWKGHENALKAISLLIHSGYPVTLDIWGGDPMRENRMFYQQVKESVIKFPSESVRLIEGRRIMAHDYESYHCLLHPAQNEPFGRVLAEALQNGLPIAGRDSGNTGDFVRNYGGGVVFENNDPESIAEALLKVMHGFEDIRRAVEKIRGRVQMDFSPEIALESLYQARILEERSAVS